MTESARDGFMGRGVRRAQDLGLTGRGTFVDALAPFGPHDLQMPLTSERNWRALQQSAGRHNHADQA